MATIGKAAIFAALRHSELTPHSRSVANGSISFRPMCAKPEMGVLVGAKGNLSSLRGGSGLLERPTFEQSQFDPIPEAQEGNLFVVFCNFFIFFFNFLM